MSRLDTAVKAASYNVLLQVSLRASGFIMNGVVLRYIQPELLGVVNLRLTLLYNTILFVSREAIRRARFTRGNKEELWTHRINVSWLPVPLGVLWSLVLGAVWLNPFIEQPSTPGDGYGVLVFCLAAVVELTAEPVWLLGQEHQHVLLKVVAEGVPQLLKCTIVVMGVVFTSSSGITVFLAAQLAYSLLYVAIYYGYFYRDLQRPSPGLPINTLKGLLPCPPANNQGLFGSNLPSLSWTFFKQSFLKQLLTDGEKYVMTIFSVLTFAEQGIYDTINNLGSLAARFIFLPIEESFYVYFSTTLYRGISIREQPQKAITEAADVLSLILRLVLIIAMTIVAFGYSYSHLALDIYGGSLLVSGGGVLLLRWYCVYVLMLAVNGVTECFMFALMSEDQVNRYNRTLMIFSGVFLLLSLFLSRLLGGVGFILANCVNMLVRVGHSCHYIHTYFTSATPPLQSAAHPLVKALPSIPTCVCFGAVAVLASISERLYCCDSGWSDRLLHMFIGFFLFLVTGAVVGFCEPDLLHFVARRMTQTATASGRKLQRHLN